MKFFFLDSSMPFQLGFQDPASPVMEGIIDLHHHINFFLLVILIFVLFFMVKLVTYFLTCHRVISRNYNANDVMDAYLNKVQYPQGYVKKNIMVCLDFFNFQYAFLYIKKIQILNKITHNHLLEIIWTFVPTIILVIIAIPSFALLYSIDEIVSPAVTIKCVGHQWYWSYEYSDYVLKTEDRNLFLNFDSYMVPESDLKFGSLRLLEVDDCIVVPCDVHVRFIVTATDVLHSWAVPSLGVKIDAVPGRLNQASVFFKREGVFYGQCSEICGVNHGFMPIVIKATSLKNYAFWVSNKLESI